MKQETMEILRELSARYPALAPFEKDVESVYAVLKECFEKGNTLYICGNGGSCADSEHIAGELLKSFKKCRPVQADFAEKLRTYGEKGERLIEKLERGLPTVSLCGHSAYSTAYANDKDPMLVFAQQVGVFGKKGDVLLTLSTSGNSQNCVYAALVAKAKDMKVVSLLGNTGGELKTLSDACVVAPEKETFKVQELHLPIYHCLCAMLEAEFFGA